MIHSTLHGPPAAARRRIAVLEIPRSELMRLGRIGTIRAEPTTFGGLDAYSGVYPTVSDDQAPSTAAQWQASIVQAQANARETTPGTLTYTPAPPTGPGANVPPWNSWAGPCATGSASGAAAAIPGSASASASSIWVYLAAGLGAAASAAYLWQAAKNERKR